MLILPCKALYKTKRKSKRVSEVRSRSGLANQLEASWAGKTPHLFL